MQAWARFEADKLLSQDTNGMQYQLMKFISARRKCVTIVGDPDQSSAFGLSPVKHELNF